MDGRRRTLANSENNPGQYSQIPMSSQRKQRTTELFTSKPSTSRLSVAVPQRALSRSSIAPHSSSQEQLASSQQSIPGTALRPSHLYTSQSGLGPAQSASRNDAGSLRASLAPSSAQDGQYAPPSSRRSSIGRRQSIAPTGVPSNILQLFTQPVRIAKDPRPVRDKAWLARCQGEIVDFLQESDYRDPLTAKTLAQPTGKDFERIFKFIYQIHDPSHKTWGKKFEDDVAPCLRAAGYPFADSISKSHLQAVGNMHSWPGIVAMLHWFVNSIKMFREPVFDTYPELCIDVNQPIPPLSEIVQVERPQAGLEYWAEYVCGSYRAFLAADEYDPQPYLDRLDDRFEATNERARGQISALRDGIENIKAEADKMDAQPSTLKARQREHSHCKRDMESIQKYVDSLTEKKNRQERQIEELTARVAEARNGAAARYAERQSLKQQVESQGLSEQEIQKLTSDRTQLDESNRLMTSKLAEITQSSLDLEVTLSRTLYQVEKLTEQYHGLATKLGLLPIGPPGFEDVNFPQELNGAAKSPHDIVPDCVTRVRPAIAALKASVTKTRQDDGESILQREEELSRILERVQDLTEVNDEADVRFDAIMKDLNLSKEGLNQHVSTSQIAMDQLTRQTNDLRNQLTKGVAADEQRLQALENEYQRVQADVNRLIFDNHEAFAEQLEMIISYKDYVTQRLEEMRDAAEAGDV